MPIIAIRDHEFDLSLESDARIISVLVAVAIGILLLSTAIFFYGYKVLRVMRDGLQSSSYILKKADTERPQRREKSMPISSTFPDVYRHPATSVREKRFPIFTSPLRKSNSVPHRSAAVYNSVAKLAHPPPAPTRRPPRQLTAPPGVVTPHIAEWMKVADRIVGRHPDAEPLCTRVASQREVDTISGHVHIPWAPTRPGLTPPFPIKVLKPGSIHGQRYPNVLRDTSNNHITIRDFQPIATSSTKKQIKRKPGRRAYGKENISEAQCPPNLSGRR